MVIFFSKTIKHNPGNFYSDVVSKFIPLLIATPILQRVFLITAFHLGDLEYGTAQRSCGQSYFMVCENILFFLILSYDDINLP